MRSLAPVHPRLASCSSPSPSKRARRTARASRTQAQQVCVRCYSQFATLSFQYDKNGQSWLQMGMDGDTTDVVKALTPGVCLQQLLLERCMLSQSHRWSPAGSSVSRRSGPGKQVGQQSHSKTDSRRLPAGRSRISFWLLTGHA